MSAGRLIAVRRRELGLSGELLARRAGIDSQYLRDLEEGTGFHPSRVALRRLAGALGTTVDAIAGAGWRSAAVADHPSAQPVVRTLDEAGCRQLLGQVGDGGGAGGRTVMPGSFGPVERPVDVVLHGGAVHFWETGDHPLPAGTWEGRVRLRVEHLDDDLEEAWFADIEGMAAALGAPASAEVMGPRGSRGRGNGAVVVRIDGPTFAGRSVRRRA